MIETSLLRRAALALKEGDTPSHDPADLLWEAANALDQASRTNLIPPGPDAEAACRHADRLVQALDNVSPLARARAEPFDNLLGIFEEPDGRRTTAENALAEDALAGFPNPPLAQPSGLADLPDNVFLDPDTANPEPSAPDTLDGAILAAAHAIRAQNARRIAGLDPDPQHAIARAEALARLRNHLSRLDDDVQTGA